MNRNVLLIFAGFIILLSGMNLGAESLTLTLQRGESYTFERPFIFGKVVMTPHIAAWIEDARGGFVKTVHVSLKGGKQDFWVGNRPHPLPVWEKIHGREPGLDAVSGASPAPSAPTPLEWTVTIPRDVLTSGGSVWVEANIGFDYNPAWPDDKKDLWGQPSLLWKAVIPAGTQSGTRIGLTLSGRSSGKTGVRTETVDGITSAANLFADLSVIITE